MSIKYVSASIHYVSTFVAKGVYIRKEATHYQKKLSRLYPLRDEQKLNLCNKILYYFITPILQLIIHKIHVKKLIFYIDFI